MKYKKGDKLLCIKNLVYAGDEFYFTSGKYYEISNAPISGHEIFIQTIHKYVPIYRGLWFKTQKNEHSSGYSFHFLVDYFISLAEWREQQINSILNEL